MIGGERDLERDVNDESQLWKWMRRAVDLAKQSVSEPGRVGAPSVGVLLAKDSEVVAEGFRGMLNPGDHAEYCALKRISAEGAEGSTVFTTLEPCTKRGPGKIPCVQRLIDAGVKEVFIGMYDPNPHIYRNGWRVLREADIKLRDFPADLRAELREANSAFLDQYRFSASDVGSVQFDYMQTPEFSLGRDPTVLTRWSHRNTKTIYAVSKRGHVASARGAHSLADIDDPSALDFQPSVHSVPVDAGGVVVFRGESGAYAVVHVRNVLSAERNDPCYLVELDYEVRLPRLR